jgi:hypothetical protein
MACYRHFILPMRRSRGFASTAPDLIALFRLAFASAPRQRRLTLPDTVSRRIIMQKARRHPGVAPVGLRPLVGVWFQVHCPPLVGVLPIVRSRYWCAIGRQGVLSLAGWAPPIRAEVSRARPYSGTGREPLSRRVRGCHPLWPDFPVRSAEKEVGNSRVAGPTTPPGRVRRVWARSAFARRY